MGPAKLTKMVQYHASLWEVSGNLDIGFQISWFPGFYWFLQVSQVEKPLETEMLKFWWCHDCFLHVLSHVTCPGRGWGWGARQDSDWILVFAELEPSPSTERANDEKVIKQLWASVEENNWTTTKQGATDQTITACERFACAAGKDMTLPVKSGLCWCNINNLGVNDYAQMPAM